jgi:hypothetical protein
MKHKIYYLAMVLRNYYKNPYKNLLFKGCQGDGSLDSFGNKVF